MIRRQRLCAIPSFFGEIAGVLLPMIEVATATARDYEIRADLICCGVPDTRDFSGDCADLSTFIWFLRRSGRDGARRIARELDCYGFALVYPYDEVLIQASRMHQIVYVGCLTERSEVDDD